MSADGRILLEVLQAELEFVEMGGYRNTTRAPWRPQFIFQDSPTCLNVDPIAKTRDCKECALIELVPLDLHGKKVPCRYVRLNEAGETIDSLYRYGNQDELEIALVKWLQNTIRGLQGLRVQRNKSCGTSSCGQCCRALN
jgi:hypothetical protein